MLAAKAASSIRPSSSNGVVSAGIGPDQVTLFLSIWAPLAGRSLAAFRTAYNGSQTSHAVEAQAAGAVEEMQLVRAAADADCLAGVTMKPATMLSAGRL